MHSIRPSCRSEPHSALRRHDHRPGLARFLACLLPLEGDRLQRSTCTQLGADALGYAHPGPRLVVCRWRRLVYQSVQFAHRLLDSLKPTFELLTLHHCSNVVFCADQCTGRL